MNLTDEQKEKVREWAGQGDSLGAIQKKLEEACGVRLTYMEARMLVADLGVSLQDKEREAVKSAAATPEKAQEEVAGGLLEPETKVKKPGGGVTVSLDSIAQPNTMVSGSVQFGDGQRAYWAIDVMGRLALDPETPGYRPTEADLVAFQTELRQAVRRAGF